MFYKGKHSETKQRFTIKKFKIGAASVLIGTLFFAGQSLVKAEEHVGDSAGTTVLNNELDMLGSEGSENNDTDGDGLSDEEELTLGTAIDNADTDGDGLNDFEEKQLGTDATKADTDADGIEDAAEIAKGTDPKKAKFSSR